VVVVVVSVVTAPSLRGPWIAPLPQASVSAQHAAMPQRRFGPRPCSQRPLEVSAIRRVFGLTETCMGFRRGLPAPTPACSGRWRRERRGAVAGPGR
jgi:hypothetical protein